ncbi:related to nitrogen regulatory protein [Rhynchosporium agropyri]|uniref:Related to nitrogen regulatory protein n=1 Tax=Rhynchosporium agropyri TaxID=914238 RepID=A0A1E1KTS2_9HELO|nr:related to nitrogen regulatory protein [Rhynchosporium agropyri]
MATKEATGGNINASNLPVNGWTRKDRPCDACRRRKSRCIIPQDTQTCIMCQSRAEQCTFVQNPHRRKGRKIEDDSGPDADKPRSPKAEKSLQSQPPINDYTSLPGSSLLKQTLGLQNRQHGHYLGQTSEYDVRLINVSPFNERGEYVSMPGTLRRVSHNVHFIMRSEIQTDVDDELANLDLVEGIVQPHGRALVGLYFRIIHPSFPIFDKKVFLEKYGRTHREFNPPSLAAVYILALNWWSYTPELANFPKPDIHRLEQLAPAMMSVVLNRPKLSTVQAGLLFLQRPDGDSWALTGQLVAVAQNLGLHLDCSKWKIPEWERSLGKRLAWGLFMQDKWGAFTHGQTADDDDDEEGSSDIETGRLTFINMITLTEVLANILRTFFTVNAIARLSSDSDNAMKNKLELAKPIQLQLKEWYSKLPKSLAIGETRARKLSPTGSLHLAYFAAEVTLHRAIIRFDSTQMDEQLRYITRNAAKARLTSAINFIGKLELAHLQSFWYFASKANLAIIGTFGVLLWATSENLEEAEFYKSQLAEYRWTLRVSSKAAEFMKYTVGLLDSSPVLLKEAGSKATTPNVQRGPPLQSAELDVVQPERQKQELNEMEYGVSEVPHSGGTFTENTFQYGRDTTAAPLATADTRPAWSGFSNSVSCSTGDVQDWSLDHLYNFENFEVAETIFTSRKFVEEYDETGNNSAGF